MSNPSSNSNERPDVFFEFRQEPISNKDKWMAAFSDSPMLFVGGGAALMVLVYGFASIKKRDKNTHLSMYLVQLRVAVQSTLTASILSGVLYNRYSKLKKKKEGKNGSEKA